MVAHHGNSCKKCAAPMLERFFVMTAHNFYIQNFQTLLAGNGCYLFERRQMPAGEDIFVDPYVTAAGCAADTNRMHEGLTSGDSELAMLAK